MANEDKNIFIVILILLVVGGVLYYYNSGKLTSGSSIPSTTFGTTAFNYNVYNEKGESYDNPIITPPLRIGKDIKIEGSKPIYICELETDKVTPSIANKECWINTLNYYDYEGEYDDEFIEPKRYSMRIGEEIKVGDYFYITWQPSGTYRREWEETIKTATETKIVKRTGFKPYQWRSTYKIELKGDFLQSYFEDEKRVVAINSDKKSNIKIVNKLSNGLSGGIYLTSQQLLFYSEETNFIDLILSRDENDYKIDLDTSTLGYDILTIQPYIKFNVPRTGEITIYDNRKSEITYNVVPNIDITVDTSINCEDRECPSGFYCEDVENNKICMRGIKPTISTVPAGSRVVDKGNIPIILLIFGIIIVLFLIFGKKR